MRKKLITAFIILFGAVTVISCIVIVNSLLQSNAEIEDFKDLAALTKLPLPSEEIADIESEPAESTPAEAETAESEPAETAPVFTRNLEPLFEKNSDCIGWIYIADTTVDYPVMYTPQEPEKYLRKNFDGEYSHSGIPFLQADNTLDSDNLIIYAHNMKNGTMFSNLTKYCDMVFCSEHPTIEFETARGLKLYSVFAVAQVKNTDTWYQFVEAYDAEDYSGQITAIEQAALYTVGDAPQYGQQLLTLSTCYGSSKNDRLIIIAVAQ